MTSVAMATKFDNGGRQW